jgi:hypothetical protein
MAGAEAGAVAEASALAEACYVYGIVPWRTEVPAGARGVGDPGGEVSLVRHRQIAAVVSGVPADSALGTRRDLLRHSQLLDAIVRSTPVLPMRFGAVLADAEAVIEELVAPRYSHLAGALQALEGRAQFTVKARYVEDSVLREVIAREPRIARLRDRLRGQPVGTGYYHRIQLGELVAGAVARRREADAAALVEELAPYARSMTWRPAPASDGIVDAALLVDRSVWPALERGVEDIAERRAERMRLRLLGPLAPYDFSQDLMQEE